MAASNDVILPKFLIAICEGIACVSLISSPGRPGPWRSFSGFQIFRAHGTGVAQVFCRDETASKRQPLRAEMAHRRSQAGGTILLVLFIKVGIAKATRNKMPEFIDVDPGNLHLPPNLAYGANPGKLARQIAKHGDSLDGMPALQVIGGKDRHLRINDGVTRATRAAKLRPGLLVPAEVIQDLPRLDVTRMPKVKDRLP
jgi:hypothetical protein